jgi:hypothetical protein
MIKQGTPSVLLVTERFTGLAKAVRTGRGAPDLPTVVMPLNPQFYAEGQIEEATEAVIHGFIDLVAPAMRERSAAHAKGMKT